jgi:hypothetical protein
MPMNFGEAYKIVCPNGGPVERNSQQFKDIMELMRQSGYLHFQEKLVHENVPVIPTRVEHVRQFTARDTITDVPVKISKNQWLSISINREAFNNHINKK